MTNDWVVAVPLKREGLRKTRLAGSLSGNERDRLADAMFQHVIAVLAQVLRVLPLPVCETRPTGWSGQWHLDKGEGLNEVLTSARAAWSGMNFAVIHADLPSLQPDDVQALLTAGETGFAIAPDRHLKGTNAIAVLAERPLTLSFGAQSLERYLSSSINPPVVIRRPGFAHDVDTPMDLHLWRRDCIALSKIKRVSWT
jgi:2-phospho-L-lactate guanylyltransferase